MSLHQHEILKFSVRKANATEKTNMFATAPQSLFQDAENSGSVSAAHLHKYLRKLPLWDKAVILAFLACLILFLRALAGLGHPRSVIGSVDTRPDFRVDSIVMSNSSFRNGTAQSGSNGSIKDTSYQHSTIRVKLRNPTHNASLGGSRESFPVPSVITDSHETTGARFASSDETWGYRSNPAHSRFDGVYVDPFAMENFDDADGLAIDSQPFALKIHVKDLQPSRLTKMDSEKRCQGSGGVRC
jgi:hypothetical protein